MGNSASLCTQRLVIPAGTARLNANQQKFRAVGQAWIGKDYTTRSRSAICSISCRITSTANHSAGICALP